MRLMSIFIEFYITVLGFVNFMLYHSLNLTYTPKLATMTEGGEKDRVAALNHSLFKTVVEEEEEQLESITVGDEEKHLEAENEREARER